MFWGVFVAWEGRSNEYLLIMISNCNNVNNDVFIMNEVT